MIDPSLTTQEKVNLVERAKQQIKEELDQKAGKVAKGELVKQGEGFTVKDGGKPYQYAQQTFKPEQWINDLSGILTDEWAANLKSLAVKHPEMFKSEADVFRVIKEIKNNPTRFFANNNKGNALILKDLDSDKVGEIAVRKSDGQIVHTTKNDKSRRLEQLSNRQKRILGNTELENSDRSARLSRHSNTSRTMATADNAGSVANRPIIPQSSQKVKELSPAELRKAIINAKDDKERLAIIENQKAGIRQNIDTKAIIDASPQSGRDMALIERENLNGDIVKYILESKKTIAVDKLDIQRARELKFKYPQDVRRTIGSDAITHVMNRHGANSILVKKSGQRAVSLDDISKWQEYADNADLRAISKDNSGQEVVVNGKQINGYYVVVEEIKKKKNELAFKTMYFEKGRLKNNEFFKNLALGTDNKSALTHSGYEPEVKLDPINARSHSDIIPQNLKNASIDEWQSEISKAKDDWNGLKRLMDQIKHSETLGQNERAKLYVDISDRMKKLREARK